MWIYATTWIDPENIMLSEISLTLKDKYYKYIYICFLRLHLKPMEVPRLGVELKPQLLAYTTATATPDPSMSVTYTTGHGSAGSPTD